MFIERPRIFSDDAPSPLSNQLTMDLLASIGRLADDGHTIVYINPTYVADQDGLFAPGNKTSARILVFPVPQIHDGQM